MTTWVSDREAEVNRKFLQVLSPGNLKQREELTQRELLLAGNLYQRDVFITGKSGGLHQWTELIGKSLLAGIEICGKSGRLSAEYLNKTDFVRIQISLGF